MVATDANCKGLNERVRELRALNAPVPMVLAIPDSHVERWLLLDGAAFKAVFRKGCDAPDLKCGRGRYKSCLMETIHATGIRPALGGIEFAEDMVREMDLERAARADKSLQRFVEELRNLFLSWQP